jgi:hypothetical protein
LAGNGMVDQESKLVKDRQCLGSDHTFLTAPQVQGSVRPASGRDQEKGGGRERKGQGGSVRADPAERVRVRGWTRSISGDCGLGG